MMSDAEFETTVVPSSYAEELEKENQSLRKLLNECVSKLRSYGKMKSKGLRRDFCNRRDEQEGEEILEFCEKIDNQLESGDKDE